MKTITVFVGILILLAVISAILYVLFGQITVRKLRKNPATKHALGIALISGWDIVNAATVLALPRVYAQKMKKRPKTGVLHANVDLLYKHTTVFDRVLARLFYWSWMFIGSSMVILIILDWFGLFD